MRVQRKMCKESFESDDCETGVANHRQMVLTANDIHSVSDTNDWTSTFINRWIVYVSQNFIFVHSFCLFFFQRTRLCIDRAFRQRLFIHEYAEYKYAHNCDHFSSTEFHHFIWEIVIAEINGRTWCDARTTRWAAHFLNKNGWKHLRAARLTLTSALC